MKWLFEEMEMYYFYGQKTQQHTLLQQQKFQYFLNK